jgi:hypothetical protein
MRTADKSTSMAIARSLALAMVGTKRQLESATKLTPAQQRRADDLRRLMSTLSRATAAIALVVTVTGCGARGYEIGGKLGFTEVDERQESQRTYNTPYRSVVCKLTGQGCPESQPSIVRGS